MLASYFLIKQIGRITLNFSFRIILRIAFGAYTVEETNTLDHVGISIQMIS